MVRRLLAIVGIALVLAALPATGRWEASRRADSQNAGIARVREQVGPLAQASLDAYRHGPGFDCLAYRRQTRPLGLELCFDAEGRVIEAIDRRGPGGPRISSLREDPTRARIRASRAEVDKLLHVAEAE